MAWQALGDFAGDRGWTQDAAGDHLVLDHGDPEGLGLVAHCAGRDHAILRKEVDWDGSDLEALALDLLVDQDAPVRLAMALHGRAGGWFETPTVSAAPGRHERLVFGLGGLTGPAWARQRGEIDRVMVLVETGSQAAGERRLRLHRLLMAGDRPLCRGARRTLVGDVESSVGPDGVFSVDLDLDLDLPAPDAQQEAGVLAEALTGLLRLQGPDGRLHEVVGYLHSTDQDGTHRYRYRFRAPATGSWRWQLGWDDGRGWRWTAVAQQDLMGGRPWRVASTDPCCLEDGSGGALWPLGQNLAWMGDPDPWFAALAAHGGSLARVWLCPWHGWLFAADRWQQIHQGGAERIDAVFAAAQRHGIQVVLVLGYHGLWAGDWSRHPANQANGGPCLIPEDSWREPRVRQAWQRYLDYVVARWGAEPALAAWELLNEADLVHRHEDEDLLAWHREMAAHLQRIDVHDHLVTTSTAHADHLPGLWRLEHLDLVQVHAYGHDPETALRAAEQLSRQVAKPLLLTEIGRDWRPQGDQADVAGRFLRRALWSSWMVPVAGGAMPWWWDTHLAPQGLLDHYRGLAAYAAGEDRRGQDLRTLRLSTGGERPIVIRALLGRDRAWAYLGAPAPGDRDLTADLPHPLLGAGAKLHLDGLADGAWTLECWDCSTGTVTARSRLQVQDGGVEIPLPEVVEDLAIKLIRTVVPAPDLELVRPEAGAGGSDRGP